MRVMDIGIFWQKQSLIPGQDCENNFCGLLDSIKDKLDDDSSKSDGYSGQIMAYINDPDGRTLRLGYSTYRVGIGWCTTSF